MLLRSGGSAIVTLVERSSRFVILIRLPRGRSSEQVLAALARRIVTLPRQLWRSLTWDQGKEMAQHACFTVETGLQIYFCDPRSPWQRGTNENTNSCCANTSQRSPTSAPSHSADSMRSRPSSTADLDKRSVGCHSPRSSPRLLR